MNVVRPASRGRPLLSIVVPAFNEAGVIERLVLDVERDIVARLGGERAVEMIVVDDCSTDGTPDILHRLGERRAWLRVVHGETNAGHGPSVARGLGLVRGDWIFQMDSDGQFVVGEFWQLWRRRAEADLVLGVRVSRRDPLHRLLLSRAVQLVVSLLARRRLRDSNVPFRLLRSAVWEDLRPVLGQAPLAPSILIAVGAVVRGRRVTEVPVTHLPRERGRSSLRSWRLVGFSVKGLWQLLGFRYRLGRGGGATHVEAGAPT